MLLIGGRITGEEVDLLRRVLDQEADPPARDVGGAMLVDRELFAQSEANGGELRNCALYVREWVEREGD
jgi:hypothetical protein